MNFATFLPYNYKDEITFKNLYFFVSGDPKFSLSQFSGSLIFPFSILRILNFPHSILRILN